MADAPQARHPGLNEYRLDVPSLRRVRFRTNFAEVASRRRRALHYKEGGLDHIEIGLQLAADPSINAARESTPSGYGWHLYVANKPPPTRNKLALAVSRDIERGMAEARSALTEQAKAEFDMSLRRLDRLISFLWKKASEGDHWAVFRIVQIEERRARMLGWDNAPKLDSPGALGGADSEIPSQQPHYDLTYVHTMYDSLVEAGIYTREDADKILEPVLELEESKYANAIDAEVIEDAPVAS